MLLIMSEPMLHLQQLLRNHLEAAGLTKPDTMLVAGVSGGADSVALLHALIPVATTCRLKLVVAHLNHGIRPEAVEDTAFVQALCHRLGVPCASEVVAVPAAARKARRSLEMQARRMRYDFFKQVADKHGARAVLTAHTRDDQAETLLLNLCRGSGPAGLGGIPPDTVIHGVRVLRPLLQASRQAIEAYLAAAGEPWREDASNRDTTYRRNAVRHQILPLIKTQLNPRATVALARAAAMQQEDNALLDQLAAAERAALHPTGRPELLACSRFRQLPPALRHRILVCWLREGGLSPARTRAAVIASLDAMAMKNAGGGCFRISHALEVQREGNLLRRQMPESTPSPSQAPVTLAIPGTTALPAMACCVDARFDIGFVRQVPTRPGVLPAEVHLRWPPEKPYCLMVRPRRPGDRLAMHGMQGSRKLQDILVDAKIPIRLRDRLPVFTIGNEVVWVPGCRPSRHWTVESPDAPSLHLRLLPAPCG